MTIVPVAWVTLVLLGWLAWSFVEYAAHRWIMHGHLPPHFLRQEHRAHHLDPTDLPTWRSLAHAVPGLLILALGSLAIRIAVGIDARPLVVGLAFGGVSYVLAHRSAHSARRRSRWVPLPWRCHLGHHSVSARSNFGFSTVLWDRAMGTFEPPTCLHEPEGARIERNRVVRRSSSRITRSSAAIQERDREPKLNSELSDACHQSSCHPLIE